MHKPSILTDTKICKITIHALPDRPGMAAEVFGRLGEEGLNISMMTATGGASGRADISFTLALEDVDTATALLESLCSELAAESVSRRDDVVLVSLVAEEMHRTPAVAGRIFRTLSTEGINIDMISATATAVTCVIDARFQDAAVESLRREFKAELASD